MWARTPGRRYGGSASLPRADADGEVVRIEALDERLEDGVGTEFVPPRIIVNPAEAAGSWE